MEESTEVKTYLTFSLGNEQFAVNVEQVLSILEMQEITLIPKAPEYIKGMINLRGEVLPVIDSKVKFGMAETELTTNTCIIVFDIKNNTGNTKVGAMVDSVTEVLNIAENEIKPVPSIGTKYQSDYLLGMIQQHMGFIMVLNTPKVFALNEVLILDNNEILNA